MIKNWTIVAALCALLLAPTVLAQEAREFRGEVKMIDSTTLTVTNLQGKEVKFKIVDQSLLPETLSVGDTVIVHHNLPTGDATMAPIVEVRLADDVDLNTDERLPQTASPLAALLITGLAALGSAVSLRRRS